MSQSNYGTRTGEAGKMFGIHRLRIGEKKLIGCGCRPNVRMDKILALAETYPRQSGSAKSVVASGVQDKAR